MKKGTQAVLFLVAALIFNCTTAFAAESNDTLKTLLDTLRTDNNLVGAVVMVRSADGTIYEAASGEANTSTHEAMTTDMHFRIASVSKTFTAALCLKLQEQGVLDLDHTLDTWFPASTIPNADTITLRHLLSMRAGIRDLPDTAPFQFMMNPGFEWSDDPSSIEQSATPALFAPDTSFHYSPNRNMVLAGLICEAATGQTFRQLLSSYIFSPYGLSEASVGIPTDTSIPSPYAHMYGFFDPSTGAPSGSLNDITNIIRGSFGMGASGMVAKARDLLDWVDILTEQGILSEASLAQMMNFQEAPGHDPYGLGLMNMGDAMGHSGNFLYGHTSLAAKVGDCDLVILANGCTVNGGAEARDMMQPIIDNFIANLESTVDITPVIAPFLLGS